MSEEIEAHEAVETPDDSEILDTPETQGQEAETAEDTTGAPEGQAKPRKSAKERIDELTAARREAEREAEYWRSRASQPQAPAPAPEQRDNAEPNPADYTYGETDVQFVRDHAAYHARKAFREEMEQERKARERQTAQQRFIEREADVAAKYDDFFSVVGHGYTRAAEIIPAAAQDAIMESELGPDLAYHLAKNPAEARRLAALNPISQAREIGRLEAKLSQPLSPQSTRAPEPAPQLRGTGGKFKPAPDTDDFTAFERTYG